MARKQRVDEPGEVEAQVIEAAGHEVTDEVPQYTSALAREEQPNERVDPAPQYQVQGTRYAMVNGSRVTLHDGKIISAAQYDIEKLRRQGVTLEPI